MLTLRRHCLYSSARVVITQCHRLGGLNNGDVFSHGSGGYKSGIEVPADLVFGGSSLSSLQGVAFLLCPHVAEREHESSMVSLLKRALILSG